MRHLDAIQVERLGEEIGFAGCADPVTILNAGSLLTLRGEVTVAGFLLTAGKPQLTHYWQLLQRV